MLGIFSSLSQLPIEQQQVWETEYIQDINSWLGQNDHWWQESVQTYATRQDALVETIFELAAYKSFLESEITASARTLPLIFGVSLVESLGKIRFANLRPTARFSQMIRKYLASCDEDLLYLHNNLLLAQTKSVQNRRHFVFSRMTRSKYRKDYTDKPIKFCSCSNETDVWYCGCAEYLKTHLDHRGAILIHTNKNMKKKTAKLRYLASDYVSEILYKMRCATMHDAHGSGYMYIYKESYDGAPRSSYGYTIVDSVPDVGNSHIHIEVGIERKHFEEIIKGIIVRFLHDEKKFK